jgi:hypothetical protein
MTRQQKIDISFSGNIKTVPLSAVIALILVE